MNLTTGSLYSFNVLAKNFNGFGENSDDLVSQICLAPTVIDTPLFVSATQSSISINWTSPLNTGGCPITSYELY
jgi:hypothetical protein